MHEDALSVVNTLQHQLSGLVREVITALSDGQMTALEGMMVTLKASTLGTFIFTLMQGMTPAMRQELLYVLEHGDWVLPP